MRIHFTLFFTLIFGFIGLNAQDGVNFWTEVSQDQITVEKNKNYNAPPTIKEHFSLDLPSLKKALKKAPMEYTDEAKNNKVLVSFPLMNGEVETFAVEESPNFSPELSAKYPSIKSYRGISTSNRLNSIRFDSSPLGLHASIHTVEGKIYIDPYANGQDEFYIAYPVSSIDRTGNDVPQSSCGWVEEHAAQNESAEANKKVALQTLKNAMDPVDMRVYRLALACTGEYGQRNGGTLESVNASFNTAINRVNQIWLAEVGIKCEIIPENDNLIYTDPLGDPYTNANMGSALLGQQQQAFAQSGILFEWYDVGHVFTNGCTDVGGVAGGTVCGNGKMRGVTCHFSNNIEFIAVQIMGHEIGHQFSCGHSWNNCPGSDDQLSAANSYEPGSGSTIMSYAGACGNGNNVQNGSDDYYNISSIEDFVAFSTTGPGNCGEIRATNNTYPELELPYNNGFYIPIRTAFELTASATDSDGDILTYCWEQYGTTSAGNNCQLGSPGAPDCPLFRSFPPTENSTRIFPRIQSLISNSPSNTELLPSTSRRLNFSCTVRDNNGEIGGNVWEVVEFRSTEEAGPFQVEFPNLLSHELEVGRYQEITWNVANTDQAPVNAEFVDIYLSTNGGFNFNEKIVSRTPNDGSEFIVVPDFVSNQARIKIKASDNIFFDMSAANFQITPPSAPNFSLAVFPQEQGVCLPAIAEVEIQTGSLLDFAENIELTIIDGVPNGVVANLNSSNLNPSENTTLVVDFSNYNDEDQVNIVLQASAEGVETVTRTISFNPVSNDYTDMALDSPEDGLSGIGGTPDFTWAPSAAANSYTIQIATNPAFEEEDIVDSAEGVIGNSYSPSVILDPTTLFYWRIIPENECGVGPQSEIFAFHTESLNCTSQESNDTPITISQSGSAMFESRINILDDGLITDVNIRNLQGSHDFLSDLELILVAPDGTRVPLMRNNCLGQSFTFDLDLDQDAPSNILCPPVGTFKPVGNLDVLQGMSTLGEWTMLINDLEAGSAGRITNWEIEFCANINLNNPSLLVNEVLPVNPGASNTIDNDFLEVQGTEVENWELIYTLVAVPSNGILTKEGVEMQVGDTFSQSNINWFGMRYEHDGSNTSADNFLFTIVDGNGGWTGTHVFEIEIDESFVVSNQEVINADDLLNVFPNPASDVLNVTLDKPFAESTQIEIIDLNGRAIQRQVLAPGQTKMILDIGDLSPSLYFVRFESESKIGTKKFTVNN